MPDDNESHFDFWSRRVASDYDRLTEADFIYAFQWTTKHGPPNCWTGTSGTAALIIRHLLAEIVNRENTPKS